MKHIFKPKPFKTRISTSHGYPIGRWHKWIYNKDNKLIYYENYEGLWIKREFEENGNEIYYVNSEGYWEKTFYDENNEIIKTINNR